MTYLFSVRQMGPERVHSWSFNSMVNQFFLKEFRGQRRTLLTIPLSIFKTPLEQRQYNEKTQIRIDANKETYTH